MTEPPLTARLRCPRCGTQPPDEDVTRNDGDWWSVAWHCDCGVSIEIRGRHS